MALEDESLLAFKEKEDNFLQSKRLKRQDINFNFCPLSNSKTWPKSYFLPNAKWTFRIKLDAARIKSLRMREKKRRPLENGQQLQITTAAYNK